jgi:hypothetical protein
MIKLCEKPEVHTRFCVLPDSRIASRLVERQGEGMKLTFQFVIIYVVCSLFWLQLITALMTIVSTGRLPYPLG